MIGLILAIFILLTFIMYALVINCGRIEKEISKEQMCKEVQNVCDHECEDCAWNNERRIKNGTYNY